MSLPAEIFGGGATSLGALLAATPNLISGLHLAGQWWGKAGSGAAGGLGTWRGPILDATAAFLASHCADDLFSASSDDKGAALLELLGFAVAVPPTSSFSSSLSHAQARSPSKARPSLRLAPTRGHFPVPVDFLRAVVRAEPSAAAGALALLGRPFRAFRLDSLLRPDCADEPSWAALRDKADKHLCAVFGCVRRARWVCCL